ncbi:MAG: CoA-binding protein [Burkholderiaceae bacterium]|nr:CoA-binding protein [Burkholderiaceae bacterium]
MSTSESETIRRILATSRTIAVVGLSPKPWRESFDVARAMQAAGWRIVPINPVAAAKGETILGERVYASLAEAARDQPIDLVNVFRNSDDVPPVADEAIAINASALWLQQGIRNETAAAKARAAGLRVVQDRCIKTERARAGATAPAPD